MNYKYAIFDMDGTILNTLEDLQDALNYALAIEGMPLRTLDEVRRFVGNGVRKLVERGAGEGASDELLERLFDNFQVWYKPHCADKTRPYEGVADAIRALRAKGIVTAVVSNKSDGGVQDLCKRFFDGLFDVRVGQRPDALPKPAPDSVFTALSALGASVADSVYIGDSEVDLATARNAGMDCIAVEWGFRDREFLKQQGASLIVSSPDELIPLITGTAH